MNVGQWLKEGFSLKITHEIRDPVHVFIKLNSEERNILDKPYFQRLRHIHQLALSYLIYPGASHKRFEHSLGVLELASRVFDVITNPELVHKKIRDMFPELSDNKKKDYWRFVLRIAALSHDLGHIPFSHASEKELLPETWDHEKITVALIKKLDNDLQKITPPLRVLDVQKLAVGPKKLPEEFTNWEAILSEIIVGDCFGVDRMDYLLRDSLHTGVIYGKFDHYRLIDTLRILPKEYGESEEPALGVEEGGLHSSEALLLARYFMFTQLYCHPVRRIYDIHLRDFCKQWLDAGFFPVIPKEHQKFSDNEVLAELAKAARDKEHPGHDPANRIVNRKHFKLLYQKEPSDLERTPEPGKVLFNALVKKFGEDYFKYDFYTQKDSSTDFPVLRRNGNIVSSLDLSDTLNQIPVVSIEYVFVAPEMHKNAEKWLNQNKEKILKEAEEHLA